LDSAIRTTKEGESVTECVSKQKISVLVTIYKVKIYNDCKTSFAMSS